MNEQALRQQQPLGNLNEENMLRFLMSIFSMLDLNEYKLQKTGINYSYIEKIIG